MRFEVLREHTGDRDYKKGDFREAAKADVQHLVQLRVLRPEAPAQPAISEKAISAAPLNKADTTRASKTAKDAA